ncbi:MAG: hypothetical protein WCW54_02420 [Candidatus Paceibacterota bacterium]
MGLENIFNKFKHDAVVTTSVLAGTAMGALADTKDAPNSPTLDTVKPTTEKSINYQEIYVDKIYQRNEKIIELKNSLDKKAGEVHKIALQIKNKIDNPFNLNDQKLKDLIVLKFYNIDATNEYLSKITDIENSGLLEIFNDNPSKEFQSLRELNKLLMEYKNIFDKIKELFQETQNLASMADSNAPISPDQIPTTIALTNLNQGDVKNVQYIQQNKNKETFGPPLKNEIQLDSEHKSNFKYLLEGISDDLRKVAKGFKEIVTDDNGCRRCGPQIFQ